jgi:8-oxo-dGTP pyrophosphatase MutT (NUDIX family)
MKAVKKGAKPKKKIGSAAAPRAQFAALPWRVAETGGVEVLLATSRDTRRWVIPKGWPMKGRKPHIVAAIEAAQEAGLHGRVEKTKIGEFHYEKRLKGDATVLCLVEVFPLRVTGQRKKFPEKGQRAIHWFPYAVAAEQVDEPELRDLILAFGAAPERAP